MRRRVVVSVPGKLILMGEHSAVYGRPALVAALDLRARVEIQTAQSGVHIHLPDIGCKGDFEWKEVERETETSRESWEAYRQDPSPERFEALRAGDATRLTLLALGEAARAVGIDATPPFRLTVRSQIPVGSGFGSSAALSVGIVAALIHWLTGEADLELIDKAAFEVERRQHGLPSGIDQKTVLHGGFLLAARRPEGGLDVDALQGQPWILQDLSVFHTGAPNETTGAVVAQVAELRSRSPESFDRLLDRMERDVLAFRIELESGSGDPERVSGLIQDFEQCLEGMGGGPEPVQEVIRRVERAGGSAKISGAGALSGDAAGCLLVFNRSGAENPAPEIPSSYRHFPVALGAEGLRVEVEE